MKDTEIFVAQPILGSPFFGSPSFGSQIWRGKSAHFSQPVISTGFANLDEHLPGGGWPQRSITEVFLDYYGIGELTLLIPALRELDATQKCGGQEVGHFHCAAVYSLCSSSRAARHRHRTVADGSSHGREQEQPLGGGAGRAIRIERCSIGMASDGGRCRLAPLAISCRATGLLDGAVSSDERTFRAFACGFENPVVH